MVSQDGLPRHFYSCSHAKEKRVEDINISLLSSGLSTQRKWNNVYTLFEDGPVQGEDHPLHPVPSPFLTPLTHV